VTSILAAGAATAPVLTAPHIEYGQLSPMLLIYGLAVVGVLVEAFAPRHLRRPLQLALTLGGLVAAFALTIVVASSNTLFAGGSPGNAAAVGTVGVDQPTLFIQGTILVLAFVSVLMIAEQSHDISPFAASSPSRPPPTTTACLCVFAVSIITWVSAMSRKAITPFRSLPGSGGMKGLEPVAINSRS